MGPGGERRLMNFAGTAYIHSPLQRERESTTAPPESDSHDNQGGAGGIMGLDRKGSHAPLS